MTSSISLQSLPFRDLDFDDPAVILDAFSDRVVGFYFAPAKRLIESGEAFAAGLITCAGVEFAAFAYKQEPHEWLADHVKIDPAMAKTFWRRFRDGLSHEGRVKSLVSFHST